MHRRHPSPLELGAYFDGESIEGVSDHVARCRRCRESLEELRGVRCAVRGELDLTDGSARRRARWTVALIPVAASIALLLAVSAPPGGLPVTRVENADQTASPAAPPLFMPSDAADVTPTSGPSVEDTVAAAGPTGTAASPGARSVAGGDAGNLGGAGGGCRRRRRWPSPAHRPGGPPPGGRPRWPPRARRAAGSARHRAVATGCPGAHQGLALG